MPDNETTSLHLVQETASVSAENVVTGRVRVSTNTDVREEVVRATLKGEVVDIVRVPVDRPVETMPTVRTEGDLTIVPVVEEVLFVEKRLVLKEEIHIRRRLTRDVVDVPVRLRRQRAVVERVAADNEASDDSNPTHEE
jgi:stress response protein YsnF